MRTLLKFIILPCHTTGVILGKSPLSGETDCVYPVVKLYKEGKRVLTLRKKGRNLEIIGRYILRGKFCSFYLALRQWH